MQLDKYWKSVSDSLPNFRQPVMLLTPRTATEVIIRAAYIAGCDLGHEVIIERDNLQCKPATWRMDEVSWLLDGDTRCEVTSAQHWVAQADILPAPINFKWIATGAVFTLTPVTPLEELLKPSGIISPRYPKS